MSNETNLNNRINKLKILTKELAKEIEHEDSTHVLDFIKLILDSVKSPAFIIDINYNLLYANLEAERLGKKYGVYTEAGIGKKCYEIQYPGQNKPCNNCPAKKAIKSKKVENTEWVSGNSNAKYMVTDIPLLYNGVAGVIEVLNPIKRINNVEQ